MDKSSVEVSSEEYVTLCCREETPSSGVVWMKDGVKIDHGVRTFYAMLVAINLLLNR